MDKLVGVLLGGCTSLVQCGQLAARGVGVVTLWGEAVAGSEGSAAGQLAARSHRAEALEAMRRQAEGENKKKKN
ncbi:hypothetical protein TIFTF001_054372 [Ficus carica]|uniref:Uncharacterized protein n=1 Tax=Ficus carica TaxID=3494 RepID=A0AA88JH23_FICCA|nr:hypothetical protein TIFTF001_054372 [Ficus carica]